MTGRPDRRLNTFSGPHDVPPLPTGSAARRVPFDDAAIVSVASVLGAEAMLAPFRLHGSPVYRLVVPVTGDAVAVSPPDAVDDERASGIALQPPGPDPAGHLAPGHPVATTVTVWPSVGRVDVANPMTSVTATGLVAVDLVPGIEAIFRSPTGSVTVVRNGRVLVRTGPVGMHPGRSAGDEGGG